MLKYVKEQMLEICLTAVEQDNTAIRYVKDEFKEICEEILE